MQLENIHPIVVMTIAVVISLLTALYSYLHRSTPGRYYLILLMLANAFWAYTSAGESVAMGIPEKILWAQVAYLGIVCIVPMWFLFAAQYSQQTAWRSIRRKALLVVFPLVMLALVATNANHGLVWSKIEPISADIGARLIYQNGPAFWIFITYGYLLTLTGTIWLFRFALFSHKLYRRQVVTLMVAIFIPYLVSIPYLFNINPWAVMNLTPLAMSFTGVMLAWGLFHFRLLDLAPVARGALVEWMRDGIVVINAEGRVEDINFAARRILGLGASDGIGLPAADLFPGWFGANRLASGKEAEQWELEWTPDCWIELRVMPIYDTPKRFNGRLIMLREITEKKRIESKMAAQVDFFEQVMNATLSGISVTDEHEHYVYVNPAFARLVGQPTQELLGKSPADFTLDLDHELMLGEKDRRILGETSTYETRLVDTNGQITPALINAVPRWVGETYTGTIAAVTDLTERKKIEENLRYREAFERILMHLSAEFVNFSSDEINEVLDSALAQIGEFCHLDRSYIFIFDEEKVKISCINEWCSPGINPAIQLLQNLPIRLLPASLEKLQKHEIIYIPSVKDLSDSWRAEREIFERQQIQSLIMVPMLYSQSLIGFIGLDSVREQRAWTDDEIRLLQVLADLFASALKRNEVELTLLETNRQLAESTIQANEMAVQAEAGNEAKSLFLATMSHEIRTPMNGVIGMTDLLAETSLTTEQKHFVDTIHSSAEALLAVINDILDFSKIEAGRMELETIEFDLRKMVENVCDLFSYPARKKGLELISYISTDLPHTLIGDPERIRQILNNLIGNAIKFTTQGEVQVNVSVDSLEPGVVVARLSVTDSGIGIPKDKVNQLFRPFIQVDASTTRQFGGSGLGLSISRKLTEMMKGEIGLDSEPGCGTTFWFTIPLAKPEVLSTPEWERYADLRMLKVLLVDGNAATLGALSTMLADIGCRHTTVQEASAVITALENAANAEDPFQTILIDCRLVCPSNLGLVREIQTRWSQLKVLLLQPPGSRQENKEICVTATHLKKPIHREALYVSLLSALRNGPEQIFPAQTSAAQHSTLQGHTVRVLLAEDNLINQDVAVSILHKKNIEVDVVANGLEAVQALAYRPYDLVLMDIQMPEMDGISATAVIRDISTNVLDHNIPIIALTANAMRGDQEMCLQAGMDDYLAKPIQADELMVKIYNWTSIGLSREKGKTNHQRGSSIGTAPLVLKTAGPPPPIHDPAESETDSLPVIEFEKLCRRMLDDRDLAMDLLSKAAAWMDADLDELKTGLQNKDASGLRHLAHKLKGSAANLSAEPMRKACEGLEMAARSEEDWGLISRLVELAVNEAGRFQEAARNLTAPAVLIFGQENRR